jgi:sulfate adenylyltransferase
MPKPRGGKLIDRHGKKDLKEIKKFATLTISTPLAEDIENIATGVFSPLEGFLCQNDLTNVLQEKRLHDDPHHFRY